MSREIILNLENPESRAAGLDRAAGVLRGGGLVAFPTESFYGLAADIRIEEAIAKLFTAKGRSPDQPVLLILPSMESVNEYAENISQSARTLMDRFWPGGLTLVFEAARTVNPMLSAGTGTIGLRLSSHPLATGLAGSLGAAVTGTSANPSGRAPACAAEEVYGSLGHCLDLILDGGMTAGGLGSTILDVSGDTPRMLRQGQVDRESLEGCLRMGIR